MNYLYNGVELPDPTSMTLGWLVGIRIAGQRKKREPITYLLFSSSEPFTIATYNSLRNWDGALYYSTNAETWNEWDGTTTLASEMDGGEQRLYMRGSGNSKITGNSSSGWRLTGSDVHCAGNIENLLDYGAVARGEHPDMTERCYAFMFDDCASLVSAPELPATELTEACYNAMFSGTSLVSAPELPATELATYCYHSMFHSCTSLVSAPKLFTTELTAGCYYQMFTGCTSLVLAPELPATTLASACYEHMFLNCTSLVSAPKLPATELAEDCYNGMFEGCTSLTTLPKLPATILVSQCYAGMFRRCTNIKLSTTQSTEYPTPYRIPTEGTGTTERISWMSVMFYQTGGMFAGTPELNTTYYTSNTVI